MERIQTRDPGSAKTVVREARPDGCQCAAPRPSARADRRLRGGLVPKAIMRVLSESVELMRARDIHAEVENLLGQTVSPSAVKNCLASYARGDQALFVRLGRGRYRVAP